MHLAHKAPAYRHFGTFRLVLALLVTLQHYFAHLAPGGFAAAIVPFEIGSVAVLVFFCLSGFVIAEAADSFYRRRPLAFIGNRMLRIVPHFIIAILLTITIAYALNRIGALRLGRDGAPLAEAAFGAKNIIFNLLSFLPAADIAISDNFLIIAWAIRVEMAFYLTVMVWIALAGALEKRGVVIFGGVGLAIALALAPLLPLASLTRAPSMLQFHAFFTFGCALYFAASRRSGVAFVVCAVACAVMAWQLLSRPVFSSETGPRAVAAEFILFAALIGLMIFLAFTDFARGRILDRFLGDLTYPLYLYHMLIMVVALSVTPGSSWGVFFIAVAASLLFAAAAQALIDPQISRLRDALRGQRIGLPAVIPETAQRLSGTHAPPLHGSRVLRFAKPRDDDY